MEQVIKIEGGHQLEGEVTISGAKNATVALIPAAVLANGPVTIVGIPQIADVNNLCEILNILNIEVTKVADDHLIIDPTNMKNTDLVQDAVTKLRASYYFMGALLGKYGHIRMKMPGGCYLGPRPIDLHIKGFEALGAEVKFEKGCYEITAKELIGTKIFLDIASVGATINIMMAAVYAKGRTTIENVDEVFNTQWYAAVNTQSANESFRPVANGASAQIDTTMMSSSHGMVVGVELVDAGPRMPAVDTDGAIITDSDGRIILW